MKKILVACIALVSSFGLLAQEPDGIDSLDFAKPLTYRIADIKVTGTEYLNHDLLIENSSLRVDQVVTIPGDDKISDAIKRLWKLGLFENIEIVADKLENVEDESNRLAYLRINLVERPRVANVTFEGATSAEEEILTESLSLIKGKPITSSLKLNINKIINDYYADKGFLNATSTFTESKDSVNLQSNNLSITINKGERVKISNIVFTGNENMPSHKIKKVLGGTKEKTTLRPVRASDVENLGKVRVGDVFQKLPYITVDDVKAFADNRLNFQLFNGSKYNPKEWETDKREITRLYNADGYRDAEVTFDTIYMADTRNLIVKANIDEGNKYYFRNITFKGNTKYSDEYLGRILGIEGGDIYDESLLEARTTSDPSGRDISSQYMDDGYLFFRAIPVETAIVGDSVDIEIFINEGKQATIGEVIIKGNDKTHEHVIRRELYTVPGNKFNRREIMNSTQRIATMGFFDETQIGVRPFNIDQSTGKVDLEYTVVEKSNDQVQMQFGYGGQSVGLVGQLGMTLTNFSAGKMFSKGAWRPLPTGDGQRLSINAALNSLTYQTYSFSFTEPWLGGKKPNSLSLSFFKQDYNFFLNPFSPEPTEKIGNQNTTGFDILFGKRLNAPDPFFVYNAGISYQTYDLENSNIFIIRNGKSTNFAVTQAFGRNSVNRGFFPTGGSRFMLTSKFTPPWSEFRDASNYVVTAGEAQQAIFDENTRRWNSQENFGGYFPLLEDDEDIPINYPSSRLIAQKGDFVEDLENAKKFEFIEYHKWRFDAEWYQQVGNSKFVVRPYAKLGYLGSYNEDLLGFSPFERFRFGGDGLSQGISTFGTTIVSQRGYDDDGDYPLNTQGGYPIFNKFGMELRYPLSGEGSTPIYAMTFLEGGNAWENFDEYDPFNLKRTAGLGLRLQLPFFGLIGFDYGVGFDKDIPRGSQFGDYNQFNLILGIQPD